MTREQAIDTINLIIGRLLVAISTSPSNEKSRKRDSGYMDALNTAIAALREPAHEWVRTTDRLPTAEDGVIGATGEPEVLAVTKYAHGDFPDMKTVSEIREVLGRKHCPYWMPLPEPPGGEGEG